ncbi:uncharacterized protein ATNIH1004_011728 [Aspergillus tanneri]|uniref:Uncharacterized protein n=1 Tax=Aspergillus tanneri TaxID=1220188 RepID=A0A5M9M3I0_9EURO|nr:uncharacterized protein ATNIH1004_011728 [Aspergillus tanneri]KAA8641592.1 hypothetical protein ATNIH1004_011728 [Aspergillus tanneri]
MSLLDSTRQIIASCSVNIKHVVLMKLERTQTNVFSLQKDSTANLTRTAEILTGSFFGFESSTGSKSQKSYDGITAKEAIVHRYSYSWKSIVGTLCGVSPYGRFQLRA